MATFRNSEAAGRMFPHRVRPHPEQRLPTISKATDEYSTSRRRLLASATAVLAAGAAIATAARGAPVASLEAVGADAELMRLCADMEAAQAQIEAISGPTRTVQFRTSEEQQEAFEAVHDEWWASFEAAIGLPAKTPDGIRAKAHMAQIAQNSLQGDSCETMYNFINSLLADLLGSAVV